MSTNTIDLPKKVTTNTIRKMKAEGRKIAMLTAYDFTMATLVDEAGVDMILIGDSATNVMAGNDTTIPMTLDEMIYHSRCVTRGAKRALVVADMPFGSYQVSDEKAVENAIRLMKESGVQAVKMEGGVEICGAVRRIVNAGIPVVGHLGLTPQSVNQLGGYGVQGKEDAAAEKLLSDAKSLEEAGCFALVLEKIPAALAEKVTQSLNIATIGIGAGSGTDGQVLVVTDMLGMNEGFRPKFLRLYAELGSAIKSAIGQYCADVREGSFPNDSEHY